MFTYCLNQNLVSSLRRYESALEKKIILFVYLKLLYNMFDNLGFLCPCLYWQGEKIGGGRRFRAIRQFRRRTQRNSSM